MKNKQTKAKILTKDLIKYSEQIGLESIPRLVFTPKEWDELYHGKRKTKRDRWLGLASRKDNLILVNLDYQGPVFSKIYRGTKHNRYIKIKPVKWELREARKTLVHELVHIRWTMGHGYAFAKRIDEILRGKRF